MPEALGTRGRRCRYLGGGGLSRLGGWAQGRGDPRRAASGWREHLPRSPHLTRSSSHAQATRRVNPCVAGCSLPVLGWGPPEADPQSPYTPPPPSPSRLNQGFPSPHSPPLPLSLSTPHWSRGRERKDDTLGNLRVQDPCLTYPCLTYQPSVTWPILQMGT